MAKFYNDYHKTSKVNKRKAARRRSSALAETIKEQSFQRELRIWFMRFMGMN